MALWREKSKKVQADRFFMEQPWPVGVLREPGENSLPYIELGGEIVNLDNGDFIVTEFNEDGTVATKYVLAEADFLEAYEIAEPVAAAGSDLKEALEKIAGLQKSLAIEVKASSELSSKLEEIKKKNPKAVDAIENGRKVARLEAELKRLREEHKHAGGR